jgi:hypothetical protein
MSTVPTESSTTWTGPRHPRAHYPTRRATMPGGYMLLPPSLHSQCAIVSSRMEQPGSSLPCPIPGYVASCKVSTTTCQSTVRPLINIDGRPCQLSVWSRFIQTISPFLVPGRGTLFGWWTHPEPWWTHHHKFAFTFESKAHNQCTHHSFEKEMIFEFLSRTKQ